MPAPATVSASSPEDPPDAPRPSVVARHSRAYQTASPAPAEIDWDRVERYLPLARSTAARLKISFPAGTSLDDLSAIALNGLIKASVQFRAEHGKSFGRYAEIRIRGALFDELRKIDRFTRGQRDKYRAVENAVQTLHNSLRRPPTEEEVAEALGLTVAEHRRRLHGIRPIRLVSLDQDSSFEDGSEETLSDRIEDVNQSRTSEALEHKELITLIRREIDNLPERHAQVVSLYYFKELNLAEIAEVLHLTESRVCQLHAESIRSLRATLKRLNS